MYDGRRHCGFCQPAREPALAPALQEQLDRARADWEKAIADQRKATADWEKADADLDKAGADWRKADAEIDRIKRLKEKNNGQRNSTASAGAGGRMAGSIKH